MMRAIDAIGARVLPALHHAETDRNAVAAIGRRLNVAVVAKAAAEAASHFSWIGQFAAMDCPASSQRTRDLLAWQPKQPGLIADLDRACYFEA